MRIPGFSTAGFHQSIITATQEEKEDGSYGGVASGSFNYGNSNPDLKTRVEADMAAWMEAHPDVKREDIPSDADGVRSGWILISRSGEPAGR
ncbi:MAG: potassium-transporting ATPase subunit C [Eisenbergiella sp.]